MHSLPSRLIAGLLLIIAGVTAAHSQAVSYVVLKGKRFIVEIAADDASREKGLMYREHMDPARGMLFLFGEEGMLAFWMKNTKIPLDMLYFDHNRKLVTLLSDVPPCRADPCPSYPTEAPAAYVLELNAGAGRKLGVKPGDVLEIHR
ncbi:MAG: DUF192 domain-containing protein [Tahibacter sp.]